MSIFERRVLLLLAERATRPGRVGSLTAGGAARGVHRRSSRRSGRRRRASSRSSRRSRRRWSAWASRCAERCRSPRPPCAERCLRPPPAPGCQIARGARRNPRTSFAPPVKASMALPRSRLAPFMAHLGYVGLDPWSAEAQLRVQIHASAPQDGGVSLQALSSFHTGVSMHKYCVC